jgi:DNA-binding response OmpR family regulator
MKVLVVDDEKDIAHIVKTTLELEGITTITASNGREAIELAVKENPDLILLDVMMPEMNGWDVFRHLKKNMKTKNIRICMLSAKALIEDLEMGKRLGVSDYITKPFEPSELVEKVKKIIDF